MVRRGVIVFSASVFAAFIGIVCVLCLAQGSNAVLSAPGDLSPAAGGAELPRAGSRGTVMTFSLCTRGSKSVDISRVEPRDEGTGLIISDFAVVDTEGRSDVKGWTARPLSRSWAADGSRRVDVECQEAGGVHYPSLVLEVTAPERTVSVFRGIEIHYNGARKPFSLPFDMRICQIPLDAAECAAAS